MLYIFDAYHCRKDGNIYDRRVDEILNLEVEPTRSPLTPFREALVKKYISRLSIDLTRRISEYNQNAANPNPGRLEKSIITRNKNGIKQTREFLTFYKNIARLHGVEY